jgi:hypothetical protein
LIQRKVLAGETRPLLAEPTDSAVERDDAEARAQAAQAEAEALRQADAARLVRGAGLRPDERL